MLVILLLLNEGGHVRAGQKGGRVIGTIADATIAPIGVIDSTWRVIDANRSRGASVRQFNGRAGCGKTGTAAASDAGTGARRLTRVSDDR